LCFKSFCQIDPELNLPVDSIIKISQQNNHSSISTSLSLSCDSGAFWSISSSGQIRKYTINGNIVVPQMFTMQGFGSSLAICDNLNGGAMSPTFYNTSSYYNGTGWNNIPVFPSTAISNGGGFGDDLYFQDNTGFNAPTCKIIKYDGTSFYTIYSANSYHTVADLAVDTSGNVWFLTGLSLAQSQFINVVSPMGVLIKSYPFNLYTIHAYGCFILNNTFYLGFGSFNPSYPNSLLPVTFTNDSAIIGVPLVMPINDSIYDLASCNAISKITDIKNSLSEEQFLKIFPNPNNGSFTIDLKTKSQIIITNTLGETILKQSLEIGKHNLSIQSQADGIYFVKVTDDKGLSTTKKIVVQK
jgi:hypothetical protein